MVGIRSDRLESFVEWVADHINDDQQVTAPGLPPSFPDPERLITDDCIRA